MHLLLRVSLLAALLAGCASPRRVVLDPSQNSSVTTVGGGNAANPIVGGGGTVQGGGGAPVAVATGSPRDRLNRVDGHLRERGFEPVGPAIRNANMQAGFVVAYPIDVQAGQCFVPVALSAEGTTMNLFVIDPMGRAIANSVATAPQGDPQLAQLLDGAAATPAVQTARLDPQTQGRLQALDQTLASDRFRRVGEPFGEVRERGQDLERPLNLQAGTCYAFASLGGPGASDTDLYILSTRWFASARPRRGSTSSARTCTPVRVRSSSRATCRPRRRTWRSRRPP